MKELYLETSGTFSSEKLEEAKLSNINEMIENIISNGVGSKIILRENINIEDFKKELDKINYTVSDLLNNEECNDLLDNDKTNIGTIGKIIKKRRIIGLIKDITNSEKIKLEEVKAIIDKLSLPVDNLEFYRGLLSVNKINDSETEISLKSGIEQKDEAGNIYSINFIWIYNSESNTYNINYKYLKNDKEIGENFEINEEIFDNFLDEIISLENLHLVDVLKYIKLKYELPKKVIYKNKEDYERKMFKYKNEKTDINYIKIDTILDVIPDGTIMNKLIFSSIEEGKKQLDKWKISYFTETNHGMNGTYINVFGIDSSGRKIRLLEKDHSYIVLGRESSNRDKSLFDKNTFFINPEKKEIIYSEKYVDLSEIVDELEKENILLKEEVEKYLLGKNSLQINGEEYYFNENQLERISKTIYEAKTTYGNSEDREYKTHVEVANRIIIKLEVRDGKNHIIGLFNTGVEKKFYK